MGETTPLTLTTQPKEVPVTNVTQPGNPRYQPKETEDDLGYDNLARTITEVEIATLRTLHEFGFIPDSEIERLNEVEQELLAITTTMMDHVEREVTHHDIRAWAHIAQDIIHAKLNRWVHIPLTSYDPIETGRALQYTRVYQKALKPAIRRVVLEMSALVRQYANQLQIGRTHGQHAIPITVGFWLATILYRIIYNWEQMDRNHRKLRGKISGAVGAHNAQISFQLSGAEFETAVLRRLDLEPAPISTQILLPEPLAYFLHSCIMMSASLAQLGRDCRHLMRSEIGEVSEAFEESQVGSSTMAHKRNPINFENFEGMWLRSKNEYGKVLDTLISEHQRDLVGSSIARDFPIILINLQQQLNTLLRSNRKGVPFIRRIHVDTEACQRNFELNSNVIMAEPLYIALQMAGFEGDAHELANRTLVPLAKAEGIPLINAFITHVASSGDVHLQEVAEAIPPEIMKLLRHPECYTGDAAERALDVAMYAENKVRELAPPETQG